MNLFGFISSASKTDVGKKRKNNEDALGAYPEAGLFCVADGMGGGEDGEIASAAVVKAVADVSRRCSGASHSATDVASAVEAGISKASEWIYKRASAKHIGVCGSTFVGVVFDASSPGDALALHAGDSRIYLLHKRSIRQITRDHSAAALMGEKDESKISPMFRSMIVNAVGVRSSVECERTPFKVTEGDRILICSDGLYRMVPEKKIAAISRGNANVGNAVDSLVGAALQAGGVDNISVVLCEIGKLPPPVIAVPLDLNEEVDDDEAKTIDSNLEYTSEVESATCETVVNGFVGDDPDENTEVRLPGESGSPARRRMWLVWLILALGAIFAIGATCFKLFVHKDEEVEPTETVVAIEYAGDAGFLEVGEKPLPDAYAENSTMKVLDATPCVPTLADAAKDVPPSADAVDDVPSAVDAADNVHPSVDEVDDVPPAADAADDVSTVADTTDDVPTAADTVNEAPSVDKEYSNETMESFVAACEYRRVAEFVLAIRRLSGPVPTQEIDEQLVRFRESAKLCSRTRTIKAVENTVTDMKFVLSSAENALDNIKGIACSNADVERIVRDWFVVVDGFEKVLEVQEACARLIIAVPEIGRR